MALVFLKLRLWSLTVNTFAQINNNDDLWQFYLEWEINFLKSVELNHFNTVNKSMNSSQRKHKYNNRVKTHRSKISLNKIYSKLEAFRLLNEYKYHIFWL